MDGGIALKQRLIHTILIGSGDVACGIICIVEGILSQRMVLVLSDIPLDIGLIDAVGSDGILELLGKEDSLAGVGTHLIVIVHKVHCVAVTVGSTIVPVVADIIKQIESTNGSVLAVHTAAHTPVTAFAIHQQVVMPRTDASIDGGRIAMISTVSIILMARDTQCLRDDTILERDIPGTTSTHRLVRAPGSCAVIHNGVIGTRHTHRIARILAIYSQAALKADMPANDVRADIDVRGLDTNALAWSRLSGNRGIGLDEVRVEVKFYDSTHVEHDIAGFVHLRQSVEQSTGFLTATETRHMINLAPSSANGIAAITLCFRES